jgi:hypothetical protein
MKLMDSKSESTKEQRTVCKNAVTENCVSSRRCKDFDDCRFIETIFFPKLL